MRRTELPPRSDLVYAASWRLRSVSCRASGQAEIMCNYRHSTASLSAPLVCISALTLALSLVEPSLQQQQPIGSPSSTSGGANVSFLEVTRKFLLEGGTSANDLIESVPYLQAHVPSGASECIQQSGLLRCMKLFVLQQTEAEKPQTGSLNSVEFAGMSDQQLNSRLAVYYQRLFKNRDLKLQILPHTFVRIVASKDNRFKFLLKKNGSNRFGGRAADVAESVATAGTMKKTESNGGIPQKLKKKKTSLKSTILQMAVPVMVMPAILMGSFLPFVLPVLKMATIMTMLMNNSAFLAALIYAARTYANSQDEQQHISYGYAAHH